VDSSNKRTELIFIKLGNLYKQFPLQFNMPKKRKSSKKKETSIEKKIEEKILDNMVELQKVHTNLAEKFDTLAKEISNLLGLFEMTAKSFAKHPAMKGAESDKEFLNKIDKLLEQNKTIAKGLTLMEEQIKGKEPEEEIQETKPTGYSPSISSSRPLPKF
jgi:hypothetical protein